MSTEEIQEEVQEEVMQNTPNNNDDNTAPQPPANYSLTQEGLNDLVQAIDELVPGKYPKQTLFNVLNTILVAK